MDAQEHSAPHTTYILFLKTTLNYKLISVLLLQAIDQAPEDAQERAVYLCNAAACYLKKQDWQLACEHCSAALKINGSYLKVTWLS